MARTRTLTNLMTDVRRRADVEGADQAYTDNEVTEYINQGIAKYHSLMRKLRGDRAYQTISTRACVAGTSFYGFATGWTTAAGTNPDIGSQTTADLAAVLGMFVNANGVQYNLDPFQGYERAELTDSSVGWTGVPLYFARRQSGVDILPTPSSASYTMTLLWVPSALRLSSGSDAFDGVDGWETLVIDWAARQVAEKDHNWELVARIDQSLSEAKEEIAYGASDLDKVMTPQVVDVRRHFGVGGRFRNSVRRYYGGRYG